MASKFEKITKHDGMEATGLVVGGALIKLYNHGLKQKVVNLPVIRNIYSMIPASMSPAFDGVFDVLLALGVGHLASMAAKKSGKGQEKVEALSKGLIGAAVVSFAMKATQSTYTAVTGNQMNGIIAVPSMNGIIAVPAMDGIIGVREMGNIGAASDFGRMDISSSDFGAPYTVGLNGGYLQKADYDSGSVIPTAPRNPDALGSYENVEYSDEESDADF